MQRYSVIRMLMFSSVLDACDRQAFLPHDFLDVGAPVLEPPQIVGNQVIFSAAWRQTLVADAEVRVDRRLRCGTYHRSE